jgi:enoyl-CoA hydratase/carnithine racemase
MTVNHAFEASASEPQYVRVTLRDHVAIITLERPPRNALIEPMITELVTALEELDTSSAARAVVVTGGVRNAFSTGGDLDALFGGDMQSASETMRIAVFERMQRCFSKIEDFPKPTIAAINGVAIGAGLELALVCDLRVASELAYFALPELRHGIIPGLGATQRLARVVGLGRAKEMLIIGRRLRAEDALAWGLVHRLAPHRATLDQALKLAREVADKPLGAFAALKRAIHAGLRHGPEMGLYQETREFTTLLGQHLEKARS